jgi:hypothetical protein
MIVAPAAAVFSISRPAPLPISDRRPLASGAVPRIVLGARYALKLGGLREIFGHHFHDGALRTYPRLVYAPD